MKKGQKILLILFTAINLLFILHCPVYAHLLDVKKFGARGDGKTDDTKSIQAAINAAVFYQNSTVYFPAGTYFISSYTITSNYFENYSLKIYSGIILKGEGNRSVIKIGDHLFDKRDTTANAHIFYGVNINNLKIASLLIDMNGANNLVPKNIIKNHMAIFVDNGSNINISEVTIKNCAGTNMIAIKGIGHGLKIEKSFFYNGGNYVGIPTPNKHQIDFSFIYSEWDSTIIVNNHIEQENVDIALSNYSGGIELHGSYSTARRNTIIGCYPAFFISSSWHPMEKTTVTNNKIEQCLRGISFFVRYPLNNITISDNQIGLTHSRLLKPGLICGILVPNGNAAEYNFKQANNASLSNLLISGNTISASLYDSAIDQTAGLVLHSLQNSRIENNKITGMNYAGVVIQGSKWGMRSVNINNNIFSDFRSNNDLKSVAGYVVITDTYSATNKIAPGIKDIFFTNNTFTATKVARSYHEKKQNRGKFFGAFIALPAVMLNGIHFDKNVFSDKMEKVVSVKTD